jgi:hypothetical protein
MRRSYRWRCKLLGRMLVRLLDEFYGRGAVLAGAMKSHAGAGLSLGLDRGMAYDLCKDERCGVRCEVSMPDGSDCRGVCGASLGYG